MSYWWMLLTILVLWIYNVDYGLKQFCLFSSGVEKSLVVYGLSPNTSYTFSASASDASGNSYEIIQLYLMPQLRPNKIVLCYWFWGFKVQLKGYKYAFETLGTMIKITFELLDTDKLALLPI
jgi:hypothetical protein